MKTSIKSLMILSAAALVLGFATTSSAEAGHKKNWRVSASWYGGGGGFGFSYGRGRWRAPVRPIYRPIYRPVCSTPVIVAPPVHVHSFGVTTQRIWIAPVYRQQIVSYDCNGAPIYQSVCVSQGYWRTVRYNTCGCGHSVELGY